MKRFYLIKHWWQRADDHKYRWLGLTFGFTQILNWSVQVHVGTGIRRKDEQP